MYLLRADEFGSADVLHYIEDQAPKPKLNQVRVRLHAAGVNPIDALALSGRYGSYTWSPAMPGGGRSAPAR